MAAAENIDNLNHFIPRGESGVRQANYKDIALVDHDGKTTTPAQQVRWEFRVFALTFDNGKRKMRKMTTSPGAAVDPAWLGRCPRRGPHLTTMMT